MDREIREGLEREETLVPFLYEIMLCVCVCVCVLLTHSTLQPLAKTRG